MSRFRPPPIVAPLGDVHTARMHLRPFEAADLDGLSRVFAKREVWEYPYGRGLSREETSAFLDAQRSAWAECGFGCWLAVLEATQEPIGYVGLSVPMFLPEILPAVEVGWRFDPAVWGQGFATEGAQAALLEGFTTMGLTEVCSLPQSSNARSFAVCERLGMTFERTVVCPANERRGSVEARLYWMHSTDAPAPTAPR